MTFSLRYLLGSLLAPFLVLPGPAPDDPAAQVRSLYERGEYAAAVRVAKAEPEPSPDTVFYHGLALARLEQFNEAQVVFQSGRARHPDDQRFSYELAGLAYRRRRMPEAKSILRDALRRDPGNTYGNDFLASLYWLDGNIAGALKYWNRINKPLIQDVLLVPPPSLEAVLLERTIAISGGQVFTLARLRTTEGNLDRLNIFSRRQIELTPHQDQRFDLTFRLFQISPPVTGWIGQLLPIARGLPYQAVHFDRSNIGDRAINFKSLWRWDPEKRRIRTDLSGVIGLNPQRGYRLLFDARDENWDLSRTYLAEEPVDRLKARKIEAGGDAVFALNDRLDWTTGLRVARRQFQNDDGALAFAGGWSAELRNQIDYRLLTLAERRVRVDSSGVLRTGRLLTGMPSRYTILEGDLSGFWTPEAKGDRWEVEVRLRAGKTFGRSPFDEFFQLGMERDSHLWLRGHVGTENGRKGNAPLGTEYVLLQAGFDRTVAQLPFLRLKAGPFFDAGWIAGPSNRFGSRGWMPDTGIQAKVIVAGGLTWSVVYGRDLRGGHGAFYTTVSR